MKTNYHLSSILCIMLLGASGIIFGQSGVGINVSGAAPDGSALLDISSTTKGLLIPRMTALQRTPGIVSPATGLIVYQTDGTPGLYMNTGTPASPSWENIFTSASGVITGTGSSNQVTFWNGTSSLSASGNLYWDNVNSRLGIGNSSPSTNLDITGNAKISGQLMSTVATGTAPLVVASTTLVPNLHAATADLATTALMANNFSGIVAGDVTGVQGSITIGTDKVNTTHIMDGTILNADINPSAAIADSKLATISTAGKVSNSATTATNINTVSTIVARDASGNFSAGTITAALNGNATTATNATSATNFSGTLSGDIGGTQSATAIGTDKVTSTHILDGTISNADINAAAAIIDTKLATISSAGKVSNSATTATNLNTINTIVARDASGNFSAGTITAALNGNATTATNATSATNFSGSLSGDVGGTQSATAIGTDRVTSTHILDGTISNADINASAAIIDSKLATIATAGKVSNSATTATNVNTASTIVARDASGNFTAGTITAALNGNATTATTSTNATNATNFTGSLAGDISGTQGLTAIGTNKVTSTHILDATILNADINAAAAIADTKLATISSVGKVANSATTATNLNTVNAIVSRDASGNFAAGTITASLNGNASSATTATTATNFSGTLAGDINGTQGATAIGNNKVTTFHIVDGTISNVDIDNTANIADTKLATIVSAGKVANSATTATLSNTPNTIVSRDANGNFAAGLIFAALQGNATTATTAINATNFSGNLSGDITGTQGTTVVTKLRNAPLANIPPDNTQVLTFNGPLNQWEPKTPPQTVSGTGNATRLAFWSGTASLSSNSNLNWDDINTRLGIGTTTPEFRLSLNGDGGIMAKGGYGTGSTLTTTGAGTRMIWYPKKSAFRVGGVNSDRWDDANIGDNSFASGFETKASGTYSTAIGTYTTASGLSSTAIGNSTTASGEYCTAMGSGTNASGYIATAIGKNTVASGEYSTAMGYGTTASFDYATAMGHGTTASGFRSTAMGYQTLASGTQATAMGTSTTASGAYSTAIGNYVTASGAFSTAIGNYVSTNAFDGSFVLGDNSTNNVLTASAIHQFTSRFNGGYRLYSGWTLTTGVLLSPGGGSWTSVSDRNLKENFKDINTEDILVKVGSLPLSNWNYKAQEKDVRHIGPMAQDFYAAFHLDGQSDTTINTLDIDGINMAAIQALKMRTDELKDAIEELKTLKEEVYAMKNDIEELKALLPKKP